jgi:acetamidase/formamidase
MLRKFDQKLTLLVIVACIVSSLGIIASANGADVAVNADSLVASKPTHHILPANSDTVRWGNIGKGTPALSVKSGDYVTVETVTHHAGDDHERIIEGDPGVEDIFNWTANNKNEPNRGPGVHILTGPIEVEGAEEGDVLEVRIVDMALRPSGNPAYEGKTYGVNAAANWGYLYNELIEEPKPREVITVYEMESSGDSAWAKAEYSYRWVPMTDPSGVVHNTIDYPGVVVDHDLVVENYDVLEDVRIPVRLHFGTMGVAPKESDIVDSVPPSYFGGNIDDWRIGKGTSVYYPVSVKGAMLSIGDPHAAQGDSELAGTAIETSITGEIQVILHKKNKLGTKIKDLNFPLLETKDEWVVHGFSYANYLEELGPNAQKDIFQKSSIDKAMKDAAHKTRAFLMQGFGLTEDEAISLMSVAVDFGITQVVDGNWGVQATIKKVMFEQISSELIPIRQQFEKLGATVKWEPTTQTVIVSARGTEMVLMEGSKMIRINGEVIELTQEVLIVDGTMMAVSEVLDLFQLE